MKQLVIALLLFIFCDSGYAGEVEIVFDNAIHQMIIPSNQEEQRCTLLLNPEDTIVISQDKAIRLFTLIGCGGGNHYEQYIMMAEKNGTWKVTNIGQIGNDRTISVEKIQIINGKILITGHTWEDTDAHCCPSKFYKKEVTINNNNNNNNNKKSIYAPNRN